MFICQVCVSIKVFNKSNFRNVEVSTKIESLKIDEFSLTTIMINEIVIVFNIIQLELIFTLTIIVVKFQLRTKRSNSMLSQSISIRHSSLHFQHRNFMIYIVERACIYDSHYWKSLHANFIRHELCVVVRAIEFVLKFHVYIFEKVESLHTSLNFKRNVQSNEFIATRSMNSSFNI